MEAWEIIEQCPACESEQSRAECALGIWGTHVACRCRYCGIDFRLPILETEDDE